MADKNPMPASSANNYDPYDPYNYDPDNGIMVSINAMILWHDSIGTLPRTHPGYPSYIHEAMHRELDERYEEQPEEAMFADIVAEAHGHIDQQRQVINSGAYQLPDNIPNLVQQRRDAAMAANTAAVTQNDSPKKEEATIPTEDVVQTQDVQESTASNPSSLPTKIDPVSETEGAVENVDAGVFDQVNENGDKVGGAGMEDKAMDEANKMEMDD